MFLRSSQRLCASLGVRSQHSEAAGSGLSPASFKHALSGHFSQPPPQHHNPFLADTFLQRNLQRIMPKSVYDDISKDLIQFGDRACTEVWALGQQCEENMPYLRQTNAWGDRVDDIVTCSAWKEQKQIAAEEGLIAIAYERRHAEFSRIHQALKLQLYAPASGLYSCPLAMTDGAAKTLEALGAASAAEDSVIREPFERLTSRNPSTFWTSGQWMTEKRGGSDVGGATETLAQRVAGNQYKVYGYKWFSSATDSDMSLLLARILDDQGEAQEGSRGVSMFFMRTRKSDGKLNGIQVAKLKNKLGTRQLPTGELHLDGADATLISPSGRGIPSISHMLTMTRMHNVISSVAYPRKAFLLSRDYATRRQAFGVTLNNLKLHMQMLSRLETEIRGCAILLVDLARQIGLSDCNRVSDQDALLSRLFLPVAKMYTARKSVDMMSELLESFGGQGYIEDTGLPGMFRDSQVLPIWEGTSNVMSLDVLRSISKSNGEVLSALQAKVKTVAQGAEKNATNDVFLQASKTLNSVIDPLIKFVQTRPELLEMASRDLTVSLAHIYITTLLTEHCLSTEANSSDLFTLSQWMNTRNICPVLTQYEAEVYQKVKIDEYKAQVYEGFNANDSLPMTYIR